MQKYAPPLPPKPKKMMINTTDKSRRNNTRRKKETRPKLASSTKLYNYTEHAAREHPHNFRSVLLLFPAQYSPLPRTHAHTRMHAGTHAHTHAHTSDWQKGKMTRQDSLSAIGCEGHSISCVLLRSPDLFTYSPTTARETTDSNLFHNLHKMYSRAWWHHSSRTHTQQTNINSTPNLSIAVQNAKGNFPFYIHAVPNRSRSSEPVHINRSCKLGRFLLVALVTSEKAPI